MQGTYYRWSRRGSALIADILGSDTAVVVNDDGTVSATVPARPMSPDEARMIGVRLIEAAAYAGAEQSTRDES